jgi:hypothetical protein
MSESATSDHRWNVSISAIEHYAYCPRQAILIWQEAFFESNLDTVRGDIAHAAVDRGGTVTGRVGTAIWRSLPGYNHELGIHGICDTVHWTTTGPSLSNTSRGPIGLVEQLISRSLHKGCACVRCLAKTCRTASYSQERPAAATRSTSTSG